MDFDVLALGTSSSFLEIETAITQITLAITLACYLLVGSLFLQLVSDWGELGYVLRIHKISESVDSTEMHMNCILHSFDYPSTSVGAQPFPLIAPNNLAL